MAIGRALEEHEREKARERRMANLRQNEDATECENYAFGEQGRTTDKVGEAVGMSGRTYNHRTILQVLLLSAARRLQTLKPAIMSM